MIGNEFDEDLSQVLVKIPIGFLLYIHLLRTKYYVLIFVFKFIRRERKPLMDKMSAGSLPWYKEKINSHTLIDYNITTLFFIALLRITLVPETLQSRSLQTQQQAHQ
jgi:hypothetical protein